MSGVSRVRVVFSRIVAAFLSLTTGLVLVLTSAFVFAANPPKTPPKPIIATPQSLGLSDAQINASAQVGAIAGQFRVDEAGAANYRVAIATAPGVAGVVPQIGLHYNSQNGPGIAGVGWALSGLSSITRCRQTVYQDGQARPVEFTQEDRFCLDGQRLVVVEGDYGARNSVYRTEIDSNAQVTLMAGTPGHPNTFKVERKDGSVSYYGQDQGRSDPRLRAGTATVSWLIARFHDNVGNPITFHYHNDQHGHRIAEIHYAYTTPGHYAAHIDFLYEDRHDTQERYVVGHRLVDTQRLRSIRSYNDNVLLRDYRLRYQDASAGAFSRLASLEACTRGDICLPATTFTWTDNETRQSRSGGTFVLSDQQNDNLAMSNFIPLDINGDGRMDIAWAEQTLDTNLYRIHYLIAGHRDGKLRYDSVRSVTYQPFKARSPSAPVLSVTDYK